MKDTEHSESLIKYCQESIDSGNPVMILMAARVLYNHFITFRGNKADLNPSILPTFLSFQSLLSTSSPKKSTIQALVLAELAILYQNPTILSHLDSQKLKINLTHASLFTSINCQQTKGYI